MEKLELLILKHLICHESYARKVIPFLKSDYFYNMSERTLYEIVDEFINQYTAMPTTEALAYIVNEKKNLSEATVSDIIEILKEVAKTKNILSNEDWMIAQTEKFCQDRAINNAVMEAVGILDGTKVSKPRGAIPAILTEALAVTFNNNVGHDYTDDVETRFDLYHQVEARIRFDLDIFNKITRGGFPVKTLNVFLAGTGVGKTMVKCHLAAACLAMGYDVLYVTLEMSETKIAERIDANLLDINMSDLYKLHKAEYMEKFNTVKRKTHGRLIIKEYPTTFASALHIKSLLNELWLKKSFRPHIIFVDYLNICASSRIKPGSGANSYTYVKSIAEEMRGLAVEFNVPIVTSTQMNRTGFSSSDPDLTDTSESFGLPATADFMCALITSEDMEQMNQIMVKQLKNRYNDPNYYKRFVLGMDRNKMKLFDLNPVQQNGLSDSGYGDDPFEQQNDTPQYSTFKF